MNALVRFNVANSFEPGEEVSFAHIAKSTGLSEPIAKSLLRHVMTMHIFYETKKGTIGHTARSMMFRDKAFSLFVEAGMEEMIPAILKVNYKAAAD